MVTEKPSKAHWEEKSNPLKRHVETALNKLKN